MKSDRIYVEHMLECIQNIEEFTTEGREAFLNSKLVQAGVIRNLEIIGEATKRLSSDIRDRHSQIPWKKMSGMRDVLIHDYMGVDIGLIWNVVAKELPVLKQQLQSMQGET